MIDDRSLTVKLSSIPVGELILKDNGNLQFRYEHGYDGPALSWSMPVRTEAYPHAVCISWFGGLLPEGGIREVISRQFGVSPQNQFGLLNGLGGDCAGAVTIAAPDDLGSGHDMSPIRLGAGDLERLIDELPRFPLGADPQRGVRMSLAGAQPKIPVIVDMFDLYLPRSSDTPTTHIVKPSLGTYPEIVQNEAFCMALARMVGLNVADAGPPRELPGGQEYLQVKRFDRVASDGEAVRVHQEDFCQALAVASERKYQVEGGPSLADSAQLIRAASRNPVADLRTLWDATVFNWAIGNCDAHGKNFSLLYDERSPRLAPLYDLASTVAYPELEKRLAMRIGEAWEIDDVSRKSFVELADRIGISARAALSRTDALLDSIKQSASLLLTIDRYRCDVNELTVRRIDSLGLQAD